MTRWKLFIAGLLACVLAAAAGEPARAKVLIQVDKPSQTMTVSVDGKPVYRWPVSTGASGFSTPDGSYKPSRMEVMHYSREWDNAGMPHAIFFTARGHSIHGSDHPGLGTPVSHGCVRLTLGNATTLYQLVSAQGMGGTTIVVSGSDPPGKWAPSMSPDAPQARRNRPLFGIFRF